MLANDNNIIINNNIERFITFSIARTLWVRSITSAVEECRAFVLSIPDDTRLLSSTSIVEGNHVKIELLSWILPLDNENQSQSALARLTLIVNEGHISLPSSSKSITTSPRHRLYC